MLYKKFLGIASFMALGLALFLFSCPSAPSTKQGTAETQTQYDPSLPLWTGDGGEGISLAVLEPTGRGITTNEQWMLSLIQGSITGDFNKYSAMTIIDRQNLEKIIAEQMQSMSGFYSDDDYIKIGRLSNAKYILGGSVSRTANAFMLELAVTDVESGVRKASLSPTPVTPAALENLSAVKEASAELLRQMGVTLTASGLAELKRPLALSQVNAETALARGVVAQRQGTEVAALSYFFQAASLDSSLVEAANRLLTVSADISSGNIGMNVRNDIAWRRDWLARLTETENFLNTLPPPYTLFYSTGIETGAINYRTEKADLYTHTILSAAGHDSLQKVLQAIYDGLTATGRKDDWGLANWPVEGVTKTNSFASQKQYTLRVVFELVNSQNRVIGKQTITLNPRFNLSFNNNLIGIDYRKNIHNTITFNSVKANDISDSLTIRIASVNRLSPQNAQFQIEALSASQWSELHRNNAPLLVVENGILLGFNHLLSASDIAQYRNLDILSENWEAEAITSIFGFAFQKKQLTSVIIPNSVTSIGDWAFQENQLTSVIIPNSVTSIENGVFNKNQLTSVTIPNSVTKIGEHAFSNNQLTNVAIPNGVTSIGYGAFHNNQLKSVTIPNSVKTIGDSAFSLNPLTSVTIGTGVTSIGNSAFYGNQLRKVTIPNNVKIIESMAFASNPLTSITIGANVKLGNGAFGFLGIEKVYYGKAGTYTRPDESSYTWTRR